MSPQPSQSALAVHFSSKTDLWATPPEFFAELDGEFGFTLDVCALPENAKCAAYFTPEEDGLRQRWVGTCWMNPPPYGRRIGEWVRKARESSIEGATVVCLLPARTDMRWWHEHVTKGRAWAVALWQRHRERSLPIRRCDLPSATVQGPPAAGGAAPAVFRRVQLTRPGWMLRSGKEPFDASLQVHVQGPQGKDAQDRQVVRRVHGPQRRHPAAPCVHQQGGF